MHIVTDEHGNVIPHGHDHSHEHEHHDHDHEEAPKTMDENLAVLKYMVEHNEHHAEELAEMVETLKNAGKNAAADMLAESVADFEMGNKRLKVAVSLLEQN